MSARNSSSNLRSLWHQFLCWANGTCRRDFDPDGPELICRCGQAFGCPSWGDGYDN